MERLLLVDIFANKIQSDKSMFGLIKKMLGDKATRDLKAVKPLLDKTLAAYKIIEQLDNDSLRAKTNEFKQKIKDSIAPEVQEIEYLKQQIENTFEMKSA